MKYNIFIYLCAIVLLVNTISAEDKVLTKEKLLELKKSVVVFKKPTITIVDGIDKGSYYFLKLNIKQKRGIKMIHAFLEKESGALYTGSRYDKNGLKMIFPKTPKAIEVIKEGISFSYGTGKKELYVVTDPECPYCKKFEKQAQGKLDDYTVHVILYPLSFHKQAPAMVEWIMQGSDDKDKKHRMEALMIDKSQEYKVFLAKKGVSFKFTNSIKTKVDKAKLAAKSLGVTGTPTIYDHKFNKLNWKTLLSSTK